MTNYDCRITYEETSGGRSILIMLHVKIEMSIVFIDSTGTFAARASILSLYEQLHVFPHILNLHVHIKLHNYVHLDI